ncbi:MAG: radical SAM protein, partial [Synergistaceae bacterium]|nr:radical SAM protein [Synergistaceae bacterium]
MIYDEFINPMLPLLASVKRPGRYTGGEWGSFVKNVPDEKRIVRICLAFPDVYEVGMSYLGFQILYSLIKTLDYADAERVYCPWPDMEREMRASGTPLTSLESFRKLRDFDILGFTLQYELCATNILTMLDLGGIPLKAAERDDSAPIVIGGGGGAYSPAPLEMFFDAFCIGEGEECMTEILTALGELKGRPRVEKLDALDSIRNIYVPGARRRVKAAIVEDLDGGFVNRTMVVPNVDIIHDRVTVQVFRGCTRGCRFCQAGMTSRPRRERGVESVSSQVKDLLAYTGCDEVGLLSLATCDWSGLDEFILALGKVLERGMVKLSLPSLRMDAFSVGLASRLEGMRRGGVTFAPEAGSERLRRVINKGLSEDDINGALEAAFKHGWDRVKLYFMMGLPTETEADLDGIIDVADRAVHLARINKRRGEVSVSVAGFVPKPHTPFQWERQATREYLRERGRYVKGRVRSKKISLSYHEPDQTFLEGVFARGDVSLGPAILEAWRRGARFDGWTECFDIGLWENVFRDEGIDAGDIASRARCLDEPLPWDMIDAGVT